MSIPAAPGLPRPIEKRSQFKGLHLREMRCDQMENWTFAGKGEGVRG
jgi:hypothetical protein